MKCGFVIMVTTFASSLRNDCSNLRFEGIRAIPVGKDYLGMEWRLVKTSYWGFCGTWIKFEV